MIETTIVGWNGTDHDRAVIEWALAHATDSKLLLVRVEPHASSTIETFASGSPAAAARLALNEETERVRQAHPLVTVDSQLVTGNPAEELARFSRPNTLVAVGTRRTHGGAARFGWSVGARLAGNAHGPVAIVPPGDLAGRSGIVVGVDGSEASEVALDVAAAEANSTGQTVQAIRAWQAPSPWTDSGLVDLEYLRSLEEMYGHILDDSVERVADAYPDLRIQRSLVAGQPAHVLVEASEGATLLIVGNHGARGITRFLLGSVSHSVILNAVSPVVVVRAD